MIFFRLTSVELGLLIFEVVLGTTALGRAHIVAEATAGLSTPTLS